MASPSLPEINPAFPDKPWSGLQDNCPRAARYEWFAQQVDRFNDLVSHGESSGWLTPDEAAERRSWLRSDARVEDVRSAANALMQKRTQFRRSGSAAIKAAEAVSVERRLASSPYHNVGWRWFVVSNWVKWDWRKRVPSLIIRGSRFLPQILEVVEDRAVGAIYVKAPVLEPGLPRDFEPPMWRKGSDGAPYWLIASHAEDIAAGFGEPHPVCVQDESVQHRIKQGADLWKSGTPFEVPKPKPAPRVDVQSDLPVGDPLLVVGKYAAKHPRWADGLLIQADGTFRRVAIPRERGTWKFDGSKLYLTWVKWGTQALSRLPNGLLQSGDFQVAPDGWTPPPPVVASLPVSLPSESMPPPVKKAKAVKTTVKATQADLLKRDEEDGWMPAPCKDLNVPASTASIEALRAKMCGSPASVTRR